MIPAGKFRAIADGRPMLQETKSGKAYVAVDFRLLDGESAGETIGWSGWLTSDKAEARTLKALRTCGWKGDDLSDLGELDQEVSITVEHEEWEGKVRAKVAWVNGPRAPLDASKAKSIAARLKAKAAATPLVDGPSSTSTDDPFA
jgi:hypothetical protein